MGRVIVATLLRLIRQRFDQNSGEGQKVSRSLPRFGVRQSDATFPRYDLTKVIDVTLRETGGSLRDSRWNIIKERKVLAHKGRGYQVRPVGPSGQRRV